MHLQSLESEQNTVMIRRECDERNRLTWPLIVVKIKIEMLNHVAPHTVVVKNLNSTIILASPQVSIEELPNEYCVRKSRGLIKIIAAACIVCELAKIQNWAQFFLDETQRITVPLTAFV